MRDDESNVKQMFQRAAGEEPSADDALARIRPRIRRAHQRRAAVRGGAGLVGVIALGAIVARSGDDGANRLRVAGTGTGTGSTVETTTVAQLSPFASSSVAPTTATSVAQSRVVPPLPSATADATPPVPTTLRSAAPTAVTATVPAAPVTPPTSAVGGASPPDSTAATAASTTSSSTSSTSTTSSTSSTAAASIASFSSSGGSVKISYTPTAMTLLEVTPAPGFTVGATEAQPDEIQVEFKRADEDGSEIHIRLMNGVPQQAHFDE